jgi:hypothetical protein
MSFSGGWDLMLDENSRLYGKRDKASLENSKESVAPINLHSLRRENFGVK